MAKGIANTKQHFIPQNYLKGFSKDGKGFYAYHKGKNLKFPMSIKRACQIDDFYKIYRKFVDEKERAHFNENYYESNFFADHIEKEYAVHLNGLRLKLTDWIAKPHANSVLDIASRDLLAAYIGIQLLRLPHVRSNYYQAHVKAEQKRFDIIKAYAAGNDPELIKAAENISLDQDIDYAAVIHAELYSDQELIDGIQDKLIEKTWAFMVSDKNDFFCSDCPIVIVPHLPKQAAYFDGIGMRGAQILFPVTGCLVISMWDSDFFDHSNFQQEQFQVASDDTKSFFNSCQYANADSHVFCASDNFEQITNYLKKENPKLPRVYKSKIEVY